MGWRTTDDEEMARRRWRGATEVESFEILGDGHAPFTNYEVPSTSGDPYQVEIRALAARENSCSCADFHISRLGTCKHIEGVLHLLRAKKKLGKKGTQSPRIEVYTSNDAHRQLKIAIPDHGLLPDGLLDKVTTHCDALG